MAKFIPVDIFDLVIFGGAGDLALRKLLPALYHRDRDSQMPDDCRIISLGRSDISQEDFLEKVRQWLPDSHKRVSRIPGVVQSSLGACRI